MKITTKGRYAIHILYDLAVNGTEVESSDHLSALINQSEGSVRHHSRGCPLFRGRYVPERRESHHGMERE